MLNLNFSMPFRDYSNLKTFENNLRVTDGFRNCILQRIEEWHQTNSMQFE